MLPHIFIMPIAPKTLQILFEFVYNNIKSDYNYKLVLIKGHRALDFGKQCNSLLGQSLDRFKQSKPHFHIQTQNLFLFPHCIILSIDYIF